MSTGAKSSWKWSLVAMFSSTMAGCNLAPTGGTDDVSLSPDSVRDPAYRMSRAQIIADYADASCDPLYTNPTVPTDGNVMRGWFGEIRVPAHGVRAEGTDWENKMDRYMKPDAVLLSAPLYMQNLDVPTREFDEGFPTMSGGTLQNDSGKRLEEYFHLNMESGLQLGDMFEEGLYEFAALSDDGVRLSIDDKMYLSSPDKHPTKLVCGTKPIQLTRGQIRGMHVEYYQGPRYHIALQLLWRKVTATTKAETLCGTEGNETWFDYAAYPPKPQAKYRELQSRGWSVVPAANFVLPGYEPLNPCLSERVKEVLADEKQ